MIGDGQSGEPQLDGSLDEIVSRRGPVKEGEIGVAVEFREDRRHLADDRTSVLFVTVHLALLVRPVNVRVSGYDAPQWQTGAPERTPCPRRERASKQTPLRAVTPYRG